MKHTQLIVLFMLIINQMMGQEITKQKEIGLLFSNLNNFGLSYRIGTSKSLWRFNVVSISGGESDFKQDSSDAKNRTNGYYATIGREWRKESVNNLELRYGAGFSYGHNKSKQDYDDKSLSNFDTFSENKSNNIGFNLILGLNYKITSQIILGAELLPGLSYFKGKSVNGYDNGFSKTETKSESSGFSYGISNSSALLSLMYRF